MKCFIHQESDAVGLCKACNKGVCKECAIEIRESIACIDTCEEKVEIAERMIQRSIFVSENQGKYKNFMPSFFMAVGISIVILEYVRRGNLGLSSIMGFIFVGFGVALYIINKKWFRQIDDT